MRRRALGEAMSSGGEVRKPWRARKTMAVSSRSQMEALKKAKGGGGGAAALVTVAPEGPEAKPFLDAKSLQDLLCRWYKDKAQHPLCLSLEVHPEVPPPAGEAPAFKQVTDVGEAALGATVQEIHQRKKRPRLEEGKEAFPEPSRPSDAGAGAERSDTKEPEVKKVKGFIQEQLAISMETLDHRLQDLHKRIERTQCLRKHEGISIKIVKRISRLDKHLNRAITTLSSKINHQGSHSQNKPPNGGTKSKEPPSNPREMSRRAAEQSDDVVCLDDNVSQNSAMQAVNPTDVGQKESSADVDVSAAAPCSSKNLFIIDLTEEDNRLRKDEEAKRMRNSAEESQTLNPPQPLLEASNQGPEDLSRLPPLPKACSHPGPVERFQGTLPPQKLALAVACLERPKGIALRWGVLDPDPRCAPVESFHLFLCQEEDSRKGILSAWRETHFIPAVSLSMACSLADFPPSTWCYFAMRARDIYGREGPFSEIRSVFTT